MIVIIVALVAGWYLQRSAVSWWNPVSWWNSANNAAGAIISQIKTWVLGAIRDAVNLVSNDVRDAVGLSVNFFVTLYNMALNIAADVINRYLTLVRWIGVNVNALERFAVHYFNTAVSYATSIFHAAISEYRHLFSWLYSWAQAALNLVEQGFRLALSDLTKWVDSGLTLLTRYAEQLFRQALLYVEHKAAEVWDGVYHAIEHDFIAPWRSIIDTVIKAWDWVLWFATHPFKLIHNVEHDVIDWGGHLAENVAHKAESETFLHQLDAIGKVLGG